MSRIRGKGNQSTEIRLVNLLRQNRMTGWRRHLNVPGRPDFAWPKTKVAVFVDGCFWHGHDCGRNLTPCSNAAKWKYKINCNKKRDKRISRFLRKKGWSVIRIWECRLNAYPKTCVGRIHQAIMKRNVIEVTEGSR